VSTILIGVDATGRSEDAVALGRRLALAGTARVVVATVTPSAHPARDQAHLIVRRMSGLLAGVEAERIHTAVVAADSPARGLHELAETESATILVVGSTHTGHLGRVRPGSTGERLLLGAPCAVAVAPLGYRAEGETPIRRIGVAYTNSPEARAALAAAIEAARAFGARLEIVTVVANDVILAPGMASVHTDVTEQIGRDLDALAADTSELVEAAGVVLEGHAWRELAHQSAHHDLLFVGSRGYGPLHAVITGGTSGPLLQHAHCPVIALARGVEAPVADLFDREDPVRSRGFSATRRRANAEAKASAGG
jgi:nucleotide-binding universal stress UspA family protein